MATGTAPADPSSIPPLIPRAVLFGNPDRVMPGISRDGRFISWIAPVDGVLNVWVAPIDNLDEARPVTDDRVRGIRIHAWPYNSRHLLYLQDTGGDENWHVHRVDLESGTTIDLTPYEGVQAELVALSPDRPDEVLIGLNDRNPELHDLYCFDLNTGERTLVLENEGFVRFTVDRRFNVRYGSRMNDDGSTDHLQFDGSGNTPEPWQPFAHVEPDDTLTTEPIGLNASGDTLHMVDSRGRDTAALVAVDVATGESRVLVEDSRADVDGHLTHPETGEVQAASFTYTRKEWVVVDPDVAADLDHLQSVVDGELDVVARSHDNRHWIVAGMLDAGPVRYHHHDRSTGRTEYLFSHRPTLDDHTLAPMHPVVITARDGLDLVSYYTLPSWEIGTKPAEPLPMVLLVHGGPWARDQWGFDPFHQLLANRGYVVLSVNFRASTGFGKSFINAGNREWGAKMHDDLLDAVDWAVANGIADRDRIAIMGGSYGGYATLAGLTFTPEVFACGVDIVGPSNIQTLIDSVPDYWRPMVKMLHTRVGDPTTPDGLELLTGRSPLTHVERIARPLLIAQGANDPRVKQAESDQIVAAMEAKGIPVTYVLYPDEGHGFARPENTLSFVAVTEAFLARHLGNDRHEPLPEGFEGSSIQVLSGAEDVPGLSAASPEG